jgi:acetylornithine deacetylase
MLWLLTVLGFEKMTVNYGTDIINLQDNSDKYLYGPGTIHVAHSIRENLTVGDLETAVAGYEQLIIHALETTREFRHVV